MTAPISTTPIRRRRFDDADFNDADFNDTDFNDVDDPIPEANMDLCHQPLLNPSRRGDPPPWRLHRCDARVVDPRRRAPGPATIGTRDADPSGIAASVQRGRGWIAVESTALSGFR